MYKYSWEEKISMRLKHLKKGNNEGKLLKSEKVLFSICLRTCLNFQVCVIVFKNFKVDLVKNPPEGRERKEGIQLTDRETRTLHRRVADEFGDSNLVRYNQLMMRKKKVKFMKSSIHGWGLFAKD